MRDKMFDPDGREVARSQEGEEQFLIAEISLNPLLSDKTFILNLKDNQTS